jgi:hypothetical protein
MKIYLFSNLCVVEAVIQFELQQLFLSTTTELLAFGLYSEILCLSTLPNYRPLS